MTNKKESKTSLSTGRNITGSSAWNGLVELNKRLESACWECPTSAFVFPHNNPERIETHQYSREGESDTVCMQDVSTEHKQQVTTEPGGIEPAREEPRIQGQSPQKGGVTGVHRPSLSFPTCELLQKRNPCCCSYFRRLKCHPTTQRADKKSVSMELSTASQHKPAEEAAKNPFGSSGNKSLKSKHFRRGILFFEPPASFSFPLWSGSLHTDCDVSPPAERRRHKTPSRHR